MTSINLNVHVFYSQKNKEGNYTIYIYVTLEVFFPANFKVAGRSISNKQSRPWNPLSVLKISFSLSPLSTTCSTSPLLSLSVILSKSLSFFVFFSRHSEKALESILYKKFPQKYKIKRRITMAVLHFTSTLFPCYHFLVLHAYANTRQVGKDL